MPEESILVLALEFFAIFFAFCLVAITVIAMIELAKKFIAHLRADQRRLTGQYYRNIVWENIMHVVMIDDDSDDEFN